MKVTLAFIPNLWHVPQICCNCGQKNPPLQQVPIETIEYTDWSGKRWRTWKFSFPYCTTCISESKKGTSLISALRGQHASVEANFVQSKKYGKLLSKKEAKYLDFTLKTIGMENYLKKPIKICCSINILQDYKHP